MSLCGVNRAVVFKLWALFMQVLYNSVPDGWLVTLINNNGVVKQPGTWPQTCVCERVSGWVGGGEG